MWKIKNSLNNVILKYFLLFSLIILFILWLFQFIFFKTFYKEQKINDIDFVANKILKNQNKNNFEEILNNLAFDNSVCIEIANNNYDLIYSSKYFGKGCISNTEKTTSYKFDFITSGSNNKTYEINTKDNITLIKALKLNNTYAFINTSLEPVSSITKLIRKQLLIITLLIIIISYTLAYFISNHISKPIKNINEKAKLLAKDTEIDFTNNSNILEIEELSTTLDYAKKELNKTDELRRDLMANVSHDLKTPLTMIKAYAELSKDLHKNKPDKQEEDMNTIIKETDRLTTLVDDILTLSKIESYVEDLNIEEFDLITLIENIISQYKVLQETEKYTFKFIHNRKKLLIKADKKKLEQVIYNLINNAINYTGDNNLVMIKVTKDKDILVEIIDTGKGIKEEDIPYIWDKYYKNKKKHKRNLVGTGLGLNIVKKILEEHKYEYGVKSTLNKGTTFYFIIKQK